MFWLQEMWLYSLSLQSLPCVLADTGYMWGIVSLISMERLQKSGTDPFSASHATSSLYSSFILSMTDFYPCVNFPSKHLCLFRKTFSDPPLIEINSILSTAFNWRKALLSDRFYFPCHWLLSCLCASRAVTNCLWGLPNPSWENLEWFIIFHKKSAQTPPLKALCLEIAARRWSLLCALISDIKIALSGPSEFDWSPWMGCEQQASESWVCTHSLWGGFAALLLLVFLQHRRVRSFLFCWAPQKCTPGVKRQFLIGSSQSMGRTGHHQSTECTAEPKETMTPRYINQGRQQVSTSPNSLNIPFVRVEFLKGVKGCWG